LGDQQQLIFNYIHVNLIEVVLFEPE